MSDKLNKNYTYVDLRVHSYMFSDFSSATDLIHQIFNDEKYAFEDIEDDDIYSGIRRQYTEFVGEWTNECEQAFDREISILKRV